VFVLYRVEYSNACDMFCEYTVGDPLAAAAAGAAVMTVGINARPPAAKAEMASVATRDRSLIGPPLSDSVRPQALVRLRLRTLQLY
jgi:hypothetical protein